MSGEERPEDIFDRLMALSQEPWSELAFGEAQMLVGRLRAALDAAPSTPEPLEVCPCCGRFSSHDHDVAPSTPEPSGLLDAAYRERGAVVAALIRTNGWPAWVAPAPDADGWVIAYAETPAGQVSWHYGPSDFDLIDFLEPGSTPWDGHTTEEKYERLAALRAAPSTEPALDDADLDSILLALRSFPTWFDETIEKVEAIRARLAESQP